MLKTLLLRGALALALTLSAALPASPQAVWKWSTTSASNSNADSAINWATGMAPSAVSPSARAMMAAVAKYRDDIGGRLTTGGTSTAYTVTSNSSIASTPNNNQLICFTVNSTNGASPTLAVDGGTAFSIKTDASTAVPAATLVSGSPYCAVYNSAASAWILHGYFGSPTTIPIGGMIPYVGASAPNSNFVLAYGQAVSRTTYSALFSLVSTTFGVGDGSTTFNLPDLRGRVIAGLDNMGGSAASRITSAGGNFDATVLGATQDRQNHTLTTAQIPSHSHTGTASSSAVTASGTTSTESADHTHSGTTSSNGDHSHTVNGTVGALSIGSDAAGGTSPVGDGTETTNTTGAHTHTLTTGGVSANHTHTVTVSGTAAGQSFTTATTGGGGSHPIIPPTMVLPMIIRIF